MKKKQYIPNVLEKYRNNLKYFKHLKNIVEAYETHKKSKALETEMNQKQRALNFRLEADRLSGELENNRLPLTTKKQLEERKAKLLYAIKHNLDDLERRK